MWEVKVKIRMTSAETKEWYDEEAEETVQSTEWGRENENEKESTSRRN